MSARIELSWPNKDKFLLVPRDEAGRPVWVEPTHPAATEVRTTEFTDSVGSVGPDPYADNLLFAGDSLDVLRVLAEVPEYRRHYRGRVTLAYIDPPFNTGQAFAHYDDSMEHSTWLSFMRDRLLLLRDLLAPDGSLWVHLDDVEQHRARCLLDEIFGATAFVTEVTWQKKYKAGNSLGIHSMTNPILVYGRTRGWRRRRGLPPGQDQTAKYRNPDDDPNGPWRLTHAGVRVYLSDLLDRGAMPTNWWPYSEVGHGETATRESRDLFAEAFSTPKPEALLQRVIHLATDPGDVVLDCFGGSGTTAAVAHKMGRRWVTAEILPGTVARFTRPRLEKVVAGAHQTGVTELVRWRGGGGFRTVQVGPSLYQVGPHGTILLTDAATGETFARAMAGQLGFDYRAGDVLCGTRGRMRLAVVDGPVGPEEVITLTGHLQEGERLTLVATVVLPQAAETLTKLSPGSRVLKAPRDVLGVRSPRSRWGASRAPSTATRPGTAVVP
ncbi:MAG TPA: site-specific DNA-methyltransferase [Kineosporiaceae bacterium]